MIPRAAYVHVPFCRHRCGYCNFTVIAHRDDLIDAFLVALERELSGLDQPHGVVTLYVGGGTPSHLAVRQLDRLLSIITAWLPLDRTHPWEFTVEVNPEDFDPERAQVMHRHGVNRISLGVQSFDSNKRQQLERNHTQDDIERSVDLAREISADVGLDLIFAAPGETLFNWRSDLQRAVRLKPDHLSTYGLTFEQGTAYWNRRLHGDLHEVDEDLQRDMYLRAIDDLTQADFEHYEVSNFARRGHRSRHNQVYWRGEPYWGFGPGAARYLNGHRETNHRSVTTWLHRIEQGVSPTAETEELSDEDQARERLVFGLRMLEGICIHAFARQTGWSIERLAGETVNQYCQQGWLELVADRLRLTRQGLLVSDSLWPGLL